MDRKVISKSLLILRITVYIIFAGNVIIHKSFAGNTIRALGFGLNFSTIFVAFFFAMIAFAVLFEIGLFLLQFGILYLNIGIRKKKNSN
ncbi:MAG: hypothetical protein KKF44_02125 [Nanoarchaeota archaeon]|nr:hypothetical protein [Nanoarchaeota archaeon]